MNCVTGSVPPPSYHANGIFVDASVADRRKMITDVIAALARIHQVDWRKCGLEFLQRRGSGTSAVEREVNWHWDAMRWGSPQSESELAPLRQWLIENQPRTARLHLNHGDTMLGNYMFRNNRLVAVLDWELCFLGNPSSEIAYLAFANDVLSLGREPLPGLPKEAEWVEAYERVSGSKLDNWDYYYVIAALKIHINMLLVFRNATGQLQATRDSVLEFTGNTLMDRWHQCRGSPR
jgi:aminoglycoside phosphotransferase (APT) family kinase protein